MLSRRQLSFPCRWLCVCPVCPNSLATLSVEMAQKDSTEDPVTKKHQKHKFFSKPFCASGAFLWLVL